MFALLEPRTRPSGVVAYPTFGRAITPRFDHQPFGALLGLRTSHDRIALLLAVLEGTCFSLRDNLDWLGVEAPLIVEGGSTHSAFWMHLKADVTGRAVQATDLEEATLLGAAILAGVGAGCYADANVGAAATVDLNLEQTESNQERFAAYDPIYQKVYSRLHDVLGDINHELGSIST
jgi:xylulokinase